MIEDKWPIYFVDPYLRFHRSWTGQAVYQFRLRPGDDLIIADDAVCSTEILRESDAVYLAALLDFLANNLLRGQEKPFPVLPD